MIQLIVGNEGKGKTTKLLERVNLEVKEAKGNIVYLDKNKKHMYELNNKVRLVDVSEYEFNVVEEFYGFVCGIISQDHDLEQLYFDNFLKVGNIKQEDLTEVLTKFNNLSDKYNIKFYMSIAVAEKEIPEEFQSSIIISL